MLLASYAIIVAEKNHIRSERMTLYQYKLEHMKSLLIQTNTDLNRLSRSDIFFEYEETKNLREIHSKEYERIAIKMQNEFHIEDI